MVLVVRSRSCPILAMRPVAAKGETGVSVQPVIHIAHIHGLEDSDGVRAP
jgi:hypothetical protein